MSNCNTPQEINSMISSLKRVRVALDMIPMMYRGIKSADIKRQLVPLATAINFECLRTLAANDATSLETVNKLNNLLSNITTNFDLAEAGILQNRMGPLIIYLDTNVPKGGKKHTKRRKTKKNNSRRRKTRVNRRYRK